MSEDFDPNNIFKILVATDNHLGYCEKDLERGNDSFNTFEEILELAVAQDVDFILLGGDLFHENKPSRSTVLKCMELLRKYTFGDKPVSFDFVSDPAENFPHLRNPCVNYQDPNLNVSIPVFSIHGNHDDPSGLGQHSPLEMLSISGLVNYFGRVNDLKEVSISPLLMTKGYSNLAIYGLSSLRDERLFRLFKENKVKMLRPKEDMDKWFNIFVIHQNRTKHSMYNYIPEEFLDMFLDLVIWGHEHESIIDHKERIENDKRLIIIQPGSSIVTSLCAGEAAPKHVRIVYIKGDETASFKMEPFFLQTVRPFVFDDLYLKDEDVPEIVVNKSKNPVENLVEQKIEKMIEESRNQLTGHPRQPTKPLIRLRVEYTDESQMFNIVRFAYRFVDRVANNDIVIFKKYRKDSVKNENGYDVDEDAMDTIFDVEALQTTKVEDLVQQYFQELDENSENQLQLLSERGLAHAVGQFIDKDDRDSISDMVMHQIDKTMEYLLSLEDLDVEKNLEEAIRRFHVERMSKKRDVDESIAFLSNPNRQNRRVISNSEQDDEFDSDLEVASDIPTSTTVDTVNGFFRGRGSRGRRARGTASTSGRRGSSSSRTQQLDFNNDSSISPAPRRGRGRGRPRASSNSLSKTDQTIREAFGRATRLSQSQRSKGATFCDDSD